MLSESLAEKATCCAHPIETREKTDRVVSRWKKNQAQDISDRVLALHCAIPKTIIQEDGCQL